MNYLEIIELRSSNMDLAALSEKLSYFIDDLNKDYENFTVKLYRHLTVETDWSFHVYYHGKDFMASPSPLGLRIASALTEFGLVHHSVKKKKKGRKE